MKQYRLTSDDVNRVHVLNRTRSMCGRAMPEAEAVVNGDEREVATLLVTMNKGCMDCMYAVLGTRKPAKRTRGEMR